YNYSYYYNGSEDPNHEVVILGWDDDYSRHLFKTEPESDGAFICMNSWGTEFGDYGVFYVSYCDTKIGKSAVAYSVIEGTDNYDHIYQNDEKGWIGRMGYDSETAFLANVYRAEGDENLRAVSFYATDKDTEYAVYVCRDYESSGDLATRRELCARGGFENMGYYTVELDSPVSLDRGEKFAVIVEINTPGSKHPVAIEMNAEDGRSGSVVLEGHESYISADGRFWNNTQEEAAGNVCLKAFTSDR
ncbi:MAG: hypothetical protein HUJ76_03740, partial [Parasporobacterium sp.]|nr:hypothetical protein [Parasporobacterium sp.]